MDRYKEDNNSENTSISEHNTRNDDVEQISTITGSLSEAEDRIGGKKRKPRRILHFSDGILEEYSTEEEQENEEIDNTSKSVVDPRSLTWMAWISWRAWASGGNVVSVLDSIGEKLAWWLGITSPKYYYEIQEALRMKEDEEKRKKDQDAEMAGWQEPQREGATGSELRDTQPEASHLNILAQNIHSPSYQSTGQTQKSH